MILIRCSVWAGAAAAVRVGRQLGGVLVQRGQRGRALRQRAQRPRHRAPRRGLRGN